MTPGDSDQTPILFQPLALRDMKLRNRVVVSPMCMYSADGGLANDFHMVHLGQYALGGAGLIITEAAAVSPEGRISPEDLGLWEDRHITPLGRITDFVHEHGGQIGIQLAHAGRKASTYAPWRGRGAVPEERGGWQVIGPADEPFSDTFPTPRAMTGDDIQRVTDAFAQAARRAEIAGFDTVEIHAAHGYLLHQFLSPLANTRTDGYGGSFENRTRLLLEVTRAVRRVWPMHKPLLVRLSATDWADGGWDESQTVVLCGLLANEGVDAVDISSGGLTVAQQITVQPAYQVPFAAQVRAAVPHLKVITVGMIDTPERAEEVLRNGDADLIALARPLLGDPHWTEAAAQRLGVERDLIPQYARGTRTT